jgi:chromosome segregation ATPase
LQDASETFLLLLITYLFANTLLGLRRSRPENTTCNSQKELSRVVEEQASIIESLKKDKSVLVSSLQSLQNEHDRVTKENQILRKAVNIQQERQNHAESELKAAHKYRDDAEEKMRKLEHLVLSLRYHLQAQHHSNNGNDFLNNLPPDVF